VTTAPPTVETSSAQPSPIPTSSPAASWTSINWVASDPAPFSGPGNQFIFGWAPRAGGSILVGGDIPLPTGNAEGVVWTAADNAHWKRVPNTDGMFSNAGIQGVAANNVTLVAVGSAALDDSATAQSVGTAWVSADGTRWRRSPDATAVLNNIALRGVAGGPPGFVAYGNGPRGGAALAFSSDGLHWQREDAGAIFVQSSFTSVTWTGHGFAAVGARGDDLPGAAAAWWSDDGRVWNQSDVGSTGYALESVQPWVGSLRATGHLPCLGCVGPPVEWRSSDDGRTWRQLPPLTIANQSGSTALLVGQRVVSLQDQPQQVSWSADGQTWNVLAMTGSPIPDGAQLVLASGETVIAIASLAGGTANNQEDMRVFAGQLH
jgi:hypothetical protein